MKLEKFKQRNLKKMVIGVLIGICIGLLAGLFLYHSFASFETNRTIPFMDGYVEDLGDVYFAFYIGDRLVNDLPSKEDGYLYDIEKTSCTNDAYIEWNYDEWYPEIKNLTKSRTKCIIRFKEQTFGEIITDCVKGGKTGAFCLKENLALNPIELVSDNTEDNNLRYIGANPNNYVSFNNELWRIIGVFNNIDDGTGNKETRIKIIRNETYSENIAWDTANTSNWVASSLKEELNTTFLNNITSPYKEMFKNAKWHLGRSYYMCLTSEYYTSERGTYTFGGYESEWIGSVGLMYPSDYGYATGGELREKCLNNEVYYWGEGELVICNTNNWVNSKGLFEWTITPYSAEEVLRIGSGGGIYFNIANITGRAATPVLYLVADIKIISGEGAESNPFVLSL